jgi:hypothetical protein
MKQLFFSFILIGFIVSCKNKEEKKPEQPQQQVKEINLPPVTNDMINKMLMEVDYIDYIFHNLPISVSQDEKESINSNIVFIKNEAVTSIPLTCKPIGRKFFNIKGETYLSADIYFGDGCAVYVFLDGEKPVYANKMTEQGIIFYNNIIATGKKQAQ